MQSQFETPRMDGGTFRNSIQHELAGLYQNAEDTLALDNTIPLIPESAYNDALFLLEILFNSGMPIPNIKRTKHGSLSLKWHTEDGKATIELCGDGLVLYNAFSDEDSKDDGTCLLSDTAALDELLGALRCVY